MLVCGAGERKGGWEVWRPEREEALPGVQERQHTGLWFRGTGFFGDKRHFFLRDERQSVFPHLSCYQDPPR